jgi:hypothetical protein
MEPTTVGYICLAGQLSVYLGSCLQGADPPPPSLCVAKAGGNLLHEEITPLLPNGIDERYCQTISNLEHALLLH